VSQRFTLGLDLGQLADYTATAVVEREEQAGRPREPLLSVRHLERVRGVPYPKIVETTDALLSQHPLRNQTAFVIDRTGVGVAVTDMFVAAGLRPIGITITGGDVVNGNERDGYRVPKRELVGSLQSALQSGRLKIAASLPLADVLVKEALNFRVTIDPRTAHDSYAAWREDDHDDLILATAMAVWHAQRVVPSKQLITF